MLLQIADFLRLCLSPRTTSRTISFSISNSFSINLIPIFNICSVLAVLSPGLFGYVLLYMCCFTWATARSQQLLFVVLAASLWCFTAGWHVKSPLLLLVLASPNPLSNRSVLHDGRKQDRRLFTTQRPPRISTSYKCAAPRYRLPCRLFR